MNKETEDKYIDVYNKRGSKHYGKGNDNQLRDWGNSEEQIRKIKIRSVKFELDWYKKGIETYKLLNSL